MSGPFNRRDFLLGSLALVLQACSPRRGGSQHGHSHLPYRPPQAADIPGFRYTVQRGDTLSSISRRCGISVSSIIRVNNMESNIIYPNDVLVLPGVKYMGDDPLRMHDEVEISGGDFHYRMVKRRSWTRQDVRSNHRLMGSVHRITIHHTGEHGNIARLPDLEVVKRIENYHRNERKWAAIGYHYLVGRDGKVYEGRPAKYQGAHTRGNNRNNLGISMIGDFNKHDAESLQLAALESLLDDMRSHYHVGKSKVFGHRDLSPSVCPGKYLYAWLKKYKLS